jgi:hypothetical protein
MAMREQEDHGERTHRRVWELLPWYVNGSLAEREREQVEAHVAGCGGCQAEEQACRRMAEGVSAAGEAAPSPHPVKLRRLLDRIEEIEEEKERAPGGWLAPVRALLRATPRPLRGALAAQAAVILLLVGLLGWSLRAPAVPSSSATIVPPAAYRTLSSPAVQPAHVERLRMMFSPRATEKEIREILHGVRGEIVAGPGSLGVYTVEVPAGSEPAAVVLAHLRTEPRVVFAEPELSGR